MISLWKYVSGWIDFSEDFLTMVVWNSLIIISIKKKFKTSCFNIISSGFSQFKAWYVVIPIENSNLSVSPRFILCTMKKIDSRCEKEKYKDEKKWSQSNLLWHPEKKMNSSFFPIHICNFILFFLVSDIILKMAIPEKSVFFDEHRRHTKHTKGKNEIQLSRTKAGSTQQKNL